MDRSSILELFRFVYGGGVGIRWHLKRFIFSFFAFYLYRHKNDIIENLKRVVRSHKELVTYEPLTFSTFSFSIGLFPFLETAGRKAAVNHTSK